MLQVSGVPQRRGGLGPGLKYGLMRDGEIVVEGPAAEEEHVALQKMLGEAAGKVAESVPRAWETPATRDQDRNSSAARWLTG